MLTADGEEISDPRDAQTKPCYDQQSLMRRFDVIADICDAMLDLGWGAYQNDHEDANGQFEMNWTYAEFRKEGFRELREIETKTS